MRSFNSLLLLLLLLLLLVHGTMGQGVKGTHHKCRPDQEGQTVTLNMWSRRVVCQCLNGIVDLCQVTKSKAMCDLAVAEAGCHFLEKNPAKGTAKMNRDPVCLDVCKGCVSNGTHIESGARMTADPTDPCRVSECLSGVLTDTTLQCPAPMCARPVHRPGQCCPSCPTCQRGLLPFAEGETKPDILDPCNECTCSGGHLTCTRRACPVLPCKPELQKRVKGQCCPVCARTHTMKFGLARPVCLLGSKSYALGRPARPDKCTECECTGRQEWACRRKTCPLLSCAKSAQTLDADGCCLQCPTALPAIRPDHCVSGNATYADGDSWTDSCRRCTCEGGQTKCGRRQTCPTCPPKTIPVPREGHCCPLCESERGVCTVFGDPHYKTFDGRIFNFQGSCKYLLAKDCSPGGREDGPRNNNGSFSVRITNDARDSLAFSWLRTITVRLDGGWKVSLMQNMKVKVNGKRVTLPFMKIGKLSVIKDGFRILVITPTVRLMWDGVSFLELSVPKEYRDRMCGLCGNFNGEPRDDFYGRHSRVLQPDGQRFGDTWRVGGLRACSVLPRDMPRSYEPHCSQSWEKRIQSDRNCNALNSDLFQQCRDAKAADDNYYFNACKLDMCECPGDQCHCEVLMAYARECERAGVLVHNWRRETNCLNVTSFDWGAHGGAEGAKKFFYRSNEVDADDEDVGNGTATAAAALGNRFQLLPAIQEEESVSAASGSAGDETGIAEKPVSSAAAVGNRDVDGSQPKRDGDGDGGGQMATVGEFLPGCGRANAEACLGERKEKGGVVSAAKGGLKKERRQQTQRRGSRKEDKEERKKKRLRQEKRQRRKRRKQMKRIKKKLMRSRRRRRRRKKKGSPSSRRSRRPSSSRASQSPYPAKDSLARIYGSDVIVKEDTSASSSSSRGGNLRRRLSWPKVGGQLKKPPFESLLRSDEGDDDERAGEGEGGGGADDASEREALLKGFGGDVTALWQEAKRRQGGRGLKAEGRTPLPLFDDDPGKSSVVTPEDVLHRRRSEGKRSVLRNPTYSQRHRRNRSWKKRRRANRRRARGDDDENRR